VVYSPPNAKGPLPVLYLAHGYSDEEKTWTVHGKAHWILDALIAQKKAVPMLIVMPNAHAIDPEGAAWGGTLLQIQRPFVES
jgi:enterochelin esterase-like enzyme